MHAHWVQAISHFRYTIDAYIYCLVRDCSWFWKEIDFAFEQTCLQWVFACVCFCEWHIWMRWCIVVNAKRLMLVVLVNNLCIIICVDKTFRSIKMCTSKRCTRVLFIHDATITNQTDGCILALPINQLHNLQENKISKLDCDIKINVFKLSNAILVWILCSISTAISFLQPFKW